jgi:hypothetical protein
MDIYLSLSRAAMTKTLLGGQESHCLTQIIMPADDY